MAWDYLAFAAFQYILLAGLLMAAYGLSLPFTGWIDRSPGVARVHQVLLRLVAGAGAAIVLLFYAGLLGFLNKAFTALVVGVGLALFALHLASRRHSALEGARELNARLRGLSVSDSLWLVPVAALLLPYLVKPLGVPWATDALWYHLPQARHWATSGSIAVNEWLLHPLFAYNMDLLYAAALVFDNDVLPGLLHTSAGLIASLLAFTFARQHFGLPVASLATLAIIALGDNWHGRHR